MTKTYVAECPACGEELNIHDCDPIELAADKGVIAECAECGAEIEFDYDPATDILTVTPGQEFEDDIIEFSEEDEEDQEEVEEEDDELPEDPGRRGGRR